MAIFPTRKIGRKTPQSAHCLIATSASLLPALPPYHPRACHRRLGEEAPFFSPRTLTCARARTRAPRAMRGRPALSDLMANALAEKLAQRRSWPWPTTCGLHRVLGSLNTQGRNAHHCGRGSRYMRLQWGAGDPISGGYAAREVGSLAHLATAWPCSPVPLRRQGREPDHDHRRGAHGAPARNGAIARAGPRYPSGRTG